MLHSVTHFVGKKKEFHWFWMMIKKWMMIKQEWR